MAEGYVYQKVYDVYLRSIYFGEKDEWEEWCLMQGIREFYEILRVEER